MMHLFFKLKDYFLPYVSPEVQEDIDRESMRNINHVSLFVTLFESLTGIIYAVARSDHFDEQFRIGAMSVLIAILSCSLGFYLSRDMLAKPHISHRTVMVFKVLFFVGFSVWGALADYRHYVLGNQMMTFYTVQLLMVCFMLFRPLHGVLLLSAAFLGFFLVLYRYDGAARIVTPNYVMLELVSMFGMMVRFQTQLHLSAKTTALTYSNKVLENVGRHDGLTGLRNRKALNEDLLKMAGRHICAFMADVNYFKHINDTYGHMVGDSVLQAVGASLRELYPNSHCYRFGGDEFLVLSDRPREELYDSDTYQFHWTSAELSIDVGLSIGSAEGTPETHEQLLELISQADNALYEVKKRTHAPANGGYERRGQKHGRIYAV